MRNPLKALLEWFLPPLDDDVEEQLGFVVMNYPPGQGASRRTH